MRHRDEITRRIPFKILVKPRTDDQIIFLTDHQIVTTGRSLHGLGNPHRPPGPRLVLDQDVPFVSLIELAGHKPSQNIGTSTGRERHDQADRLVRIGLRRLCLGCTDEAEEDANDGNDSLDHE